MDLTGLSGDQQMQAGLFCGNVFPTLTAPLSTCPGNLYGSKLVQIPVPGTENDDLFHGDRYKWSLRFTVINPTNKTALYNFLSTFSGTHYVTPRTATVELGFHF